MQADYKMHYFNEIRQPKGQKKCYTWGSYSGTVKH